jgi:glycosyltransferase involved in cell wall biosynthesis
MVRVLELRTCDGPGGGPEKTILAGAQRASEVDVTVCYLRDASDACAVVAQQAASLGLDYVEVRTRGACDGRVFFRLREIVRQRQVDLVHAHEYKSNLLALLLAKRKEVVPLSTAHGWTGDHWRERYCYYPLDKRVLRRFPQVVSVSSEITRSLIGGGVDSSRIVTIPNGIDAAQFRRDAADRRRVRRRLGIGDGEFLIGSVGRVERQKRFDLLLDVVAHLRPRHPMLRLAVAGDGSLRDALQEQARRQGLADCCQFVGHFHPVGEFYSALDLYVQTSDYEGTANVVLEAMAMEVPLAATEAGGTRDLLREGVDGLIARCGDVESIAGCVQAVLDDPAAAAERVVAARRRVEGELSFDRRCARLEEVYLRLHASRQQANRA